MWSQENKHALLRFLPQAMLTDAFSSSEAVGMGLSVSTAAGESQTAAFIAGPECAVFTEDHRRVAPGSGERGLVAVGGHMPLGYYGDDEKTKRTFAFIEGKRWSIPGDWATVEADGSFSGLAIAFIARARQRIAIPASSPVSPSGSPLRLRAIRIRNG